MKFAAAFAVSVSLFAAPVAAQTAADWRTVEPQNLLVIETSKGRILVEMDPRIAPVSVERVRTLADRGFYDGLKFHRVIADFMAQTGDPMGTGQGGSDLPNINAEFQFRRGRDAGFVQVQPAPASGLLGVVGSMPVATQPDAQMMVTADFRTAGQALFCTGVAGMARNGNDENSANSQFFLMTADREDLNGQYTPFGRVVAGLDVLKSIKVGTGANGSVVDPDVMTRTRTAAALPEAARPTVRVMNPASPAFAAFIEQAKAAQGAGFGVCDAQPPVEVVGG